MLLTNTQRLSACVRASQPVDQRASQPDDDDGDLVNHKDLCKAAVLNKQSYRSQLRYQDGLTTVFILLLGTPVFVGTGCCCCCCCLWFAHERERFALVAFKQLEPDARTKTNCTSNTLFLNNIPTPTLYFDHLLTIFLRYQTLSSSLQPPPLTISTLLNPTQPLTSQTC